MPDSGRTHDYLAVVEHQYEDQLISLSSQELARHALRDACYFDRYRATGTRGVMLHFRGAAPGNAVFDDIAALARTTAASFDACFVPVIDDPKAALGAVFGGPDSIRVYRSFSFDSADFVWQCHQAGLSQADKRLPVAAEMLVDYMYCTRSRLEGANAAAYPGLFVSFRSHFEGFAASLDEPGAAEREFDQRYPKVEALLNRLVPAYEQGDPAACPGWLKAWHALIDRYFDEILQRVHGQTLVTGMSAEMPGRGKNLLASTFHEKIVSNKEYTGHAMKNPLFQANRILLGLVYLTLYRLGLPLIERYFLCYCLSRHIGERHGVTAETAFDQALARSARKRRWSWLRLPATSAKASI